jgi:hypothetical protein
MLIPGLGSPIGGPNLPRFVGLTQRAGGVPLGAGTGSFSDTNGMTVPAGATGAIVCVKCWHSAVDAFAVSPAVTVHGISGTLIAVCNDNVSDNANQVVALHFVQGLTPGAVGTVSGSQGGLNPNQGFIWAAMHFDSLANTGVEDSAFTLSLANSSMNIGTFDTTKPSLVVGVINHSMAAGNAGTPPAPFTSALDLAMSVNSAVRMQLIYGYEYAPVTAKTYTFTTPITDNRHGGVVAAIVRV